MLEVKNVTAGYGSNRVLKELSATFEKGQLTSIIGVNGCGKSTLLKTILRILPPSSGTVTLDGTELRTMSRNAIAQRIAYLPQGKSVPDMTVVQLVLHGRFPHIRYPRHYTPQDKEIAAEAMQRMGLEASAHKNLHTLSGGMQQSAYIAMVLAQGAEYILLDEPTTHLDISHQLQLMQTLRRLSEEGKGIVAVMHDLPMAFTFSHRIVLIQDGQVVESGSPAQLCANGATEKFFGIPLALSPDGKSYHYRYP